ncbi:MAG: hybrid sensor histidine kinase/response regulator [Hyphomicrobiales bacterium]|nr:MAG: hybrid sensor histidine kinase/response regulator [Hyphomicrobiales bacterium]
MGSKNREVILSRQSRSKSDEELVELGLNLIHQGLSIFNEQMCLIAWNRRFHDMFEFPADILHHGLSFREINLFLARRGEFGPGDPEQLADNRVELAKKFEAHYFERTRPNGRRISVEGNPLAEGGWVTIYSDITDSYQQEQMLKARSDQLSDKLLQHSGKLAETNRKLSAANRALTETKAALQGSEQRLLAITQAMPAHIAYLDKQWRYTFSNNRFEDVMGISREGLIGKPITDIFPPAVFAGVKPRIELALKGQTVITEYEMPAQGGHSEHETRHIRSTFTPDMDDKGKVLGLFVLSLDISSERAATELLLRSKRMETTAQLTSGLAHDFNNILTIVLGNLARLSSANTPESLRQDIIATTEKAAKRGTRIIDGLMTFLFRQKYASRDTNISRILRELSRLFSASLRDGTRLQLNLPDTDIRAELDEGVFQDVVLNMLFNARDALASSKQTGLISLTASIVDIKRAETEPIAHLKLVVEDNGTGFTDIALKHAEQPFFTTKQEGKGTGLGLATVRNFVERSGGALALSNGQNGGAIVSFQIPLVARSVDEDLEPEHADFTAPDGQDGNNLMLVVDDDPELRVLIRTYANAIGYPVVEAASADEACALLENVAGISVVVSDIVMPGRKNGLDLAKKVKVPMLLVSSLEDDNPLIMDAMRHTPVLKKPFEQADFIRALGAVVQANKGPESS